LDSTHSLRFFGLPAFVCLLDCDNLYGVGLVRIWFLVAVVAAAACKIEMKRGKNAEDREEKRKHSGDLKLQLNSHTSNDSLSPALGTYLFFVCARAKKAPVDRYCWGIHGHWEWV